MATLKKLDPSYSPDESSCVSFIITMFNAEKYIKTAITNIENIAYKNKEIIVFDDGSIDESVNICEKLSKRIPYLNLIESKRIGRAKALNAAILCATGDIIAINDADDKSCPNRLNCTLPILKEYKDAGLLATDTILVNEDESSITKRNFIEFQYNCIYEISPQLLYRKNFIGHSSVVFRKTIWELVGGYNENLSSCIDYEFYFRCIAESKLLYFHKATVSITTGHQTVFQRESPLQLCRNLFLVKRTARQKCRLTFWTRIYDVNLLYFCIKRSILFNWRNFVRALPKGI